MVYNAWTVLNDAKRPSTMLAAYSPTVATGRRHSAEYAFLDDIRDFHVGGRTRFTRFKPEYSALCARLVRLLGRLDFAMPQVCLIPGKKLDLMVRDWSRSDPASWAGNMHEVWVELHHLRIDLNSAREPRFQRTVFASLPKSVLCIIVALCTPEDARNLAATSRTFQKLCSPKLDQYGKVAISHSHASLDRAVLNTHAREISSPRNSFGLAIAAAWAWFCARGAHGRSDRTQHLHIVNRWTWAWNAYAEFKWVEKDREVSAWSTAFSRGMKSLGHLRDLRLDGLALSSDVLLAISLHSTLRGLHVNGCGIPLEHETPVLPTLRGIRRLTVCCDPASGFETATGARLIHLCPNVVRLRVESRVEDGPLPLALHTFWKGPPMRALQELTLRDVDVQSTLTLLAACLSRRLEKFRLRFQITASDSDVDTILMQVVRCSSLLSSLVLDGISPPTVVWLGGLVARFPGLTELGLLARGVGRSISPVMVWNTPVAAVGEALVGANSLVRLCTNMDLSADTIDIGPPDSRGARRASQPARPCRLGCAVVGGDGVISSGAMARAIGLVSDGLEEIVIVARSPVYAGLIFRTTGPSTFVIEPGVAPVDRDDPWWKL